MSDSALSNDDVISLSDDSFEDAIFFSPSNGGDRDWERQWVSPTNQVAHADGNPLNQVALADGRNNGRKFRHSNCDLYGNGHYYYHECNRYCYPGCTSSCSSDCDKLRFLDYEKYPCDQKYFNPFLHTGSSEWNENDRNFFNSYTSAWEHQQGPETVVRQTHNKRIMKSNPPQTRSSRTARKSTIGPYYRKTARRNSDFMETSPVHSVSEVNSISYIEVDSESDDDSVIILSSDSDSGLNPSAPSVPSGRSRRKKRTRIVVYQHEINAVKHLEWCPCRQWQEHQLKQQLRRQQQQDQAQDFFRPSQSFRFRASRMQNYEQWYDFQPPSQPFQSHQYQEPFGVPSRSYQPANDVDLRPQMNITFSRQSDRYFHEDVIPSSSSGSNYQSFENGEACPRYPKKLPRMAISQMQAYTKWLRFSQ